MVIINHLKTFFLFVILCTVSHLVSTVPVKLSEAIHQVEAQLIDLTPAQRAVVIAQLKNYVLRNNTRLINQETVTNIITAAQQKNQPIPHEQPNISEPEQKKDNRADQNTQQEKEFARVMAESKKGAYANIFEQHPAYGLIIKKLHALQDLPLTQLCAILEKNPLKSGAHSIRNAWAIAQLVRNNIPVTAESIQEQAQTNPDIINELDGDIEGIMSRAEFLNLSDAYFIECTENKLIGYYIHNGENLIPFSTLHVHQLLSANKASDRWTISFICKLGTRHFLVSLVKQAGKEPAMFYLDPQNEQMSHNSYVHKCVQEIHRICFEQSRLTRLLTSIQHNVMQPIMHTIKRIAHWVTNLF